MPIVKTACLVLQTYRFGDTSKILRLMTRDLGPRSAMARGALRPKSRVSGLLEPFAEGVATLYLKPNRDLHTLSGFDLVRSRQGLGAELPRFGGASAMAEIVLRLAPEQADPELYDALRGGLDALLDAPAADVSAISASRLWALVRILGFAPLLDRCIGCGAPLGDRDGARLDTRAGGARCLRCGGAGHVLSPADLADLRALVEGRVPARVEGGQVRLLREFIRVHVAEGVRLRSLDFLDAPDG